MSPVRARAGRAVEPLLSRACNSEMRVKFHVRILTQVRLAGGPNDTFAPRSLEHRPALDNNKARAVHACPQMRGHVPHGQPAAEPPYLAMEDTGFSSIARTCHIGASAGTHDDVSGTAPILRDLKAPTNDRNGARVITA
ncbi:hypothetical protein MRX96_041169 [Rhipicephalus microplus]